VANFHHALVLLLLVSGFGVMARWLPWPAPITYVLGGLGCGFLPGFPRVELDPGFFFVCFLPPLLFADGWTMPLREFARARGAILLLATGLVIFTTVGVGLVAWWLVPGLPAPMAFALGALVSPTDAVAVNAITERLKVPTRLRIVLNGESLMNDATGLVAFKFAIAAMVLGTFSVRSVAIEFLVLALGGLLIGFLIAFGVGRLRDVLRHTGNAEPFTETTISLLTPFASYLAAESVHVSGVLAVVAAGLYSGWRDPIRMDVETRRTTWSVWTMVLYWLNGLAFLLLGLQLPTLTRAVAGQFPPAQLALFVAVLAATTMALRLFGFVPGVSLSFTCTRRDGGCPSWKENLVGGWAGMRGTVTLAAALSIPLTLDDGRPFPGRDLVIFFAGGIVLATLLVQGTTLEGLIHRLGLREDGMQGREEHLARLAAVEAGLAKLRVMEAPSSSPDELEALRHVAAEYEHRRAELAMEGETRTVASRRLAAGRNFRLAALAAERATVDELWRNDTITDDVHRPLQQLLDYEETLLRGREPKAE
jgi:Na+/H+ antiporter